MIGNNNNWRKKKAKNVKKLINYIKKFNKQLKYGTKTNRQS